MCLGVLQLQAEKQRCWERRRTGMDDPEQTKQSFLVRAPSVLTFENLLLLWFQSLYHAAVWVLKSPHRDSVAVMVEALLPLFKLQLLGQVSLFLNP